MATKITTRSAAKALGLNRYFTGEPCVRGHIVERITASGSCRQCQLDDRRARRAEKPGYRTRADISAETNAPTRVCSNYECQGVFPSTSEFFVPLRKVQPSGTVTEGLSRECRTCRNMRFKPYYETNREREIARVVANVRERRKDPVFLVKDRKWSREAKRRKLADPTARAEATARNREWVKENPDRVKGFYHCQPHMRRMRAMARRAAELNATTSWLTVDDKKQIEEIYALADRLTRETGVKYDVDHHYPLMGKTSCGLHVPWNLRVITRTANQAKGNRLPERQWTADDRECDLQSEDYEPS